MYIIKRSIKPSNFRSRCDLCLDVKKFFFFIFCREIKWRG